MKKLIAAMIALSCMSAQAEDIRLGQPAYGGSGCPAGSAGIALSPNQKSVSILFDEYMVEAGGFEGRVGRKTCNIAVPVHVPQGYTVSVFQVDYRGYAYVPSGGMARFNAEYFFAGSQGPKVSKTFSGFTDKEYLVRNNLQAQTLVWSACGASTNLRVNTSMMVRTNSRREEALATVDSADVKAGIEYHLQWKRCN